MLEQDLNLIKKTADNYSDKIEGKKIVVTGGAGFLGSWLCDSLILCGAEVVCVDNLSSGTFENIKHLNDNFEFIKEDVNRFAKKYDFSGTFHISSCFACLV